jgi:hypothetical protein
LSWNLSLKEGLKEEKFKKGRSLKERGVRRRKELLKEEKEKEEERVRRLKGN